MKNYLQLNDISAYKTALNLSNYVWNIVIKWDHFAKDTIGKQFVRAIDSVSANIAEGFGRYTKKDKINFYRYSYGSVKESLDWIQKARMRKLLTKEEYTYLLEEFQNLPKDLHSLIQFTQTRLTM